MTTEFDPEETTVAEFVRMVVDGRIDPEGVTVSDLLGGRVEGEDENLRTLEDGRGGFGDTLRYLRDTGDLHLHAPRPDGPTDSLGYNTAVHHWADGDLVASATADARHTHWNVYTRTHETGVSSVHRQKRVSVGGGTPDTLVDVSAAAYDGEPREARLKVSASGRARLVLKGDRGDLKVNWLLDPDSGRLRLHDYRGEGDLLSFGLGDDWGQFGGALGRYVGDLEERVADVERRLQKLEGA